MQIFWEKKSSPLRIIALAALNKEMQSLYGSGRQGGMVITFNEHKHNVMYSRKYKKGIGRETVQRLPKEASKNKGFK